MGVIRNPLVLIRADIRIYKAIMDWQMLDLSFHEYMKENWSGKQDCFEGWRGSLFLTFLRRVREGLSYFSSDRRNYKMLIL